MNEDRILKAQEQIVSILSGNFSNGEAITILGSLLCQIAFENAKIQLDTILEAIREQYDNYQKLASN